MILWEMLFIRNLYLKGSEVFLVMNAREKENHFIVFIIIILHSFLWEIQH